MESNKNEYPDRINLNFQDTNYVFSQRTKEDLLAIEAKNPQSGEFYTVWVRTDGMAKILSEIGKMLSS